MAKAINTLTARGIDLTAPYGSMHQSADRTGLGGGFGVAGHREHQIGPGAGETPLGHRPGQGALEGGAVPGVRFGSAADVEVGELVEEGLEDVAGADVRVGGDREAKLGGDGEAEPVGAAAGPAHPQLRGALGQRSGGEDGQVAEASQLGVEGDAGDQVVGAGPAAERSVHGRNSRRPGRAPSRPSYRARQLLRSVELSFLPPTNE